MAFFSISSSRVKLRAKTVEKVGLSEMLMGSTPLLRAIEYIMKMFCVSRDWIMKWFPRSY